MSRILAALSLRIEQTSLRRTAEEARLSPSGLRKVLAGSSVHPATVRKLESWAIRNRDRSGEGELDRETAEAALRLLTETASSPRKRKRMVDAFLSMVEDDCREAGRPVPAWVEALRKDQEDAG